ncbi:MAG TPA: hypothetical protein VIJ51_11320 [Solirubrobacteraceae bacterium]
MRRTFSLIALLAVTGAAAACGGPPASPVAPASDAPGIAGLQRAIQDARGAVATSQRDAARASGTSAGP